MLQDKYILHYVADLNLIMPARFQFGTAGAFVCSGIFHDIAICVGVFFVPFVDHQFPVYPYSHTIICLGFERIVFRILRFQVPWLGHLKLVFFARFKSLIIRFLFSNLVPSNCKGLGINLLF